jgi:hypothetical protein
MKTIFNFVLLANDQKHLVTTQKFKQVYNQGKWMGQVVSAVHYKGI